MKDEEMAEEYRKALKQRLIDEDNFERLEMFDENVEESFLAGLKAGRPQWHKVTDGDLPKIENRIVLCVCENGYIDGKRNYKLKLLTRKEFPLFQPVIKWCEIPTFDKE